MSKSKVQHKAIFHRPERPLTANDAAAIYGLTEAQLVRRIRDNEDGLLERLTKQRAPND